MFLEQAYITYHQTSLSNTHVYVYREPKFCQEKIFANFAPVLVGKNITFSHVDDCIGDMATFTVLVKIDSAKCFSNTNLVEFLSRKFSALRYEPAARIL